MNLYTWWRKLFNPPTGANPAIGVYIRFPWQVMLVEGEEYRKVAAWWDCRAEAYAREMEGV